VLVALVVVALLVTAGGFAALVALGSADRPGTSDPVVAVSTPPAPGATRAPRPALARFYAQRLDWQPCQDSFLCATLTVPLDYRRPGGETLELALLQEPAQDPRNRIGSLVVNPGGPGVPGTSYAAAAARAFGTPLRDRFDIVGFDPRGTGGSDPVDCLSDAELDDYVAADPDPDTAAEELAYRDAVTAFGAGCVERSGALASHISTIEAARDLDVLRAALGESRLTYLGASYGTELGATYADLFPRKAGRLVLDGAVDLSLDFRETALEQAAGFETALRSYVQNCVDSTDSCFLGDTVEEGLARIKRFLDDVDAKPVPTATDRDLEVGNAFYGIALPLYSRDLWTILSQGLRTAFDGDGSTLLRISDAYTTRLDGGTYGDNRIEAILAITCLDDPASIPASDVAADIPAFEAASPTFGRVFAWGLTNCSGVRVRSSEKPRDVRAVGAPPIVVVGTSRDPATPMKWAEALAAQLESGVLVRRDGDGHTGYHSGNDCVDEAVEAYLIEGTVPTDGLSC
jgi:pimeloyl-ACP methyl ester carboxylesterase